MAINLLLRTTNLMPNEPNETKLVSRCGDPRCGVETVTGSQGVETQGAKGKVVARAARWGIQTFNRKGQ